MYRRRCLRLLRTAVNDVVAIARAGIGDIPVDGVISGSAIDQVVALAAHDGVVTRVAGDGVGPRVTGGVEIARPGQQDVFDVGVAGEGRRSSPPSRYRHRLPPPPRQWYRRR